MAPPLTFTLAELAACCDGRIVGHEQTKIQGLKNLRQADARHLSLFTDKRYADQAKHSKAAAVITSEALSDHYTGNKLIAENPLLALAMILNKFEPAEGQINTQGHICASARVSRSASVHPSVTIGANVSIGKHVMLEEGVSIGAGSVIQDNVHIGVKTQIDANVTIYRACVLGERCHLSAGVVIGADGFGFAEDQRGSAAKWVPIPQIAKVRIGDEVHIGANTAIDRGSLEDTCIGNGVIIDNLVQIGHNVQIGAHTAIAGCAAIAGSTHIGKHCKIGGCVAIDGHLKIADNVTVLAKSLLTKSVDKAGVYSSAMPAMPVLQWRKLLARFRLQSGG